MAKLPDELLPLKFSANVVFGDGVKGIVHEDCTAGRILCYTAGSKKNQRRWGKMIAQRFNAFEDLVKDVEYLLDYARQTRNNLLTNKPVRHVDLDTLDDLSIRLNMVKEVVK